MPYKTGSDAYKERNARAAEEKKRDGRPIPVTNEELAARRKDAAGSERLLERLERFHGPARR